MPKWQVSCEHHVSNSANFFLKKNYVWTQSCIKIKNSCYKTVDILPQNSKFNGFIEFFCVVLS